jgi:hypothetical protein
MARLLAAGDLHYGALESIFGSKWKLYTDKVLNQVIIYAKLKGIKHVVFTADIFNVSQPSQLLLTQFVKFFMQFKEITFHFYLGNHDFQSDESNSLMLLEFLNSVKLITNIKCYTQPTLESIEGKNINFLPWPHTKQHKDADLVFAHVPVKGSVTDSGRLFKDAFDLKSKVKWVIGDLHKYQKGDNWIFPGALFQLKAIDDPVRYMLDINIKDKTHIETIEINLPYQIKVLKITKQLKDFNFLNDKHTKWQIYADYDIAIPEHKNILRRLPLSDKSKLIDNAVNSSSVLEQEDFIHHLDKWLRGQGLNKQERKLHQKIFMKAAESVRHQ